MRILMLSSTFPYPPSLGGTEIRTFNLLVYLQQHHEIILATQRDRRTTDQQVEELRQWVKELHLFPLPENPKGTGIGGKIVRFAEAIWKATPSNVLHRYSPQMQALVDRLVESGECDVITCEHSVNEIYVRPQWQGRVRTVVDVHSSIYGWTRNHLEMGASQNPWRDRFNLILLLERYERRYCRKFSKIVVTTEDDRTQLQIFNPQAQIAVIPNGVDFELFQVRDREPEGYGLVFVGDMSASHNIDAARFFALNVLPEMQKSYPQTTFTIVGGRPTQEVLALGECPGVIVTGRVPSTVEYLHACRVCVVPLRTGFGIKNKTLEGMAAGVPVVASDRGLEGLAVDGEGVPLRALRANTVSEYVQAITRLFEEQELRQQLTKNARLHVEQEYTWQRAGELYEQVLTVAS